MKDLNIEFSSLIAYVNSPDNTKSKMATVSEVSSWPL